MSSDGNPVRAEGRADGDSNAQAFGRIFLLILITEHWTRALGLRDSFDTASTTYLVVATLSSALAWPVDAQCGFTGLALVQVLVMHRDFRKREHAYLSHPRLLLALLDPYVAAERHAVVLSVRWTTAAILWSGIEVVRLLLPWRAGTLATIESFRPVLSLVLPASEMTRLSAYTGVPGDGSYRVDGLTFVLLSNAVYVTEISLAGLLLFRRTRTLAVVLAMLFLLAVESAAREIFFGLLFINALLLFLGAHVHTRLTPVFGVVLLTFLLIRLGYLPTFVFY
jgi:hypothetical protein